MKRRHAGEIDVSKLPLGKSGEYLRTWAQPRGPATCLVDPVVSR